MLLQVSDALDTAHAAGLIHRDIKPQNILVSAAGRDHAFLADFGVSKSTGVQSLTSTGYMVGTLDYVSPEQIQGRAATRASDVYAFAAVVYECLTGVVPFPRDSDAAVLYAHMSEPPPDVSERRPELPSKVGKALQRGMAKDPADRPATTRELIEDIERALGPTLAAISPPAPIQNASEAGIRFASDASTPRQAWASRRRGLLRRGRSIAFALLLLLAVGIVGGFALGSRASGSTPADPDALSTGGARLSLPSTWTRLAPAPALGLELESELAAGPLPDRGIVVGTTAAPPPTYLPAGFRSRLPAGALAARQVVQLGPHEAFRYEGLAPTGDSRRVTVYVVLLENRVVSLACFTPTAAVPFLAECEDVASTVELSHSFALRGAAYARAFNGVDRSFKAARTAGLTALRRATTPAAQAAALRTLASAADAGATRLASLRPSPASATAHRDVLAGLRALRDAYSRTASAAAAGKKDGYRTSRVAVTRAETDLEAAVEKLAATGFRLP